ncbi:MAG: hypothetical protein MJZ50_07530 [Treponema sp.]|nr:hypothetical protein [Treponema sp.]
MAATFNTSQMMSLDFYQENYEEILGEKIKPGLANLIDFMTGKQAYELLCEMLGLCR